MEIYIYKHFNINIYLQICQNKNTNVLKYGNRIRKTQTEQNESRGRLKCVLFLQLGFCTRHPSRYQVYPLVWWCQGEAGVTRLECTISRSRRHTYKYCRRVVQRRVQKEFARISDPPRTVSI